MRVTDGKAVPAWLRRKPATTLLRSRWLWVNAAKKVKVIRIPLEKRLRTRTNRRGPIDPVLRTRCHVYTGPVSKAGRGSMHVIVDGKSKSKLVYHIAFYLMWGRWPVRLNHLCDNPRCIREDHLREGTHKENMREKAARGRAPRGEGSHFAKLTEAQVVDIRSQRGGATNAQLGKQYGVTGSVVSRIQTGKLWKHVSTPRLVTSGKDKAPHD
jgi:hypothetical protein